MQALGRPSPAAAVEPPLRTAGEPSSAAYRAEGGGTGEFRLRAATVAGVGHRLSAEVNQDSYAWAHEGSRLAVAVADGLGSVPGSGAAARLAASTAVAAALDPSRAAPAEAAHAAVSAAGAALAGSGGGATTLVLAIIERADGDAGAALARIGDSTAFLVPSGPDGPVWQELFDPPAGGDEEVGVATPALSGGSPATPAGEEGPPVETATLALSDGDVLALVTDGIAGPWRDGPTTVAPAMVDGLRARPSALELAQLADFSRQGCHDDRTMVVVWLAGA